jgi:anti-sigma factor RsiW
MREQCSRFEELLIASTLHEISESDRTILEEHLAHCPECPQYHRDLQEDDRRLSAYVKTTEPLMHDLESRVLRHVAERIPEKQGKVVKARFWGQRGWIPYAAAAAALVMAVGYFLFDLNGTFSIAPVPMAFVRYCMRTVRR